LKTKTSPLNPQSAIRNPQSKSMASSNRNSQVVGRYARALLQLANKTQQAEPVREELRSLREVLDKSPAFAATLADPGVSEGTRQQLIERTFNGRALPVVVNFLGLLNSKGRIGLLREIVDEYEELLEAQLGNVEVDVTVAQRLDDAQLEQVRARVSKALGRNAVVQQYVDESIIGGLVLRVQDKLIDASVRQQLEAMRRQLLAASPR
jgi:F-type H+-transporting ATPase subunit delta